MSELLLIAAGSCFLLGGFVGWVVGHAAGFLDGREAEKQAAVDKQQARRSGI